MSTDSSSRVPTSSRSEGWSLETMLDHVLALIAAYDTRYEQRFDASQKALDAAFAAQKSAVDAAFSAQKEAIIAALAAQDRAVSKAEAAAEKRFEGVNEFRAQLGDQQRNLMPRAEAEKLIQSLADKIGVLEGFRTEVLSRGTGAKEGWGYAVGVIGLVFVVLGIIAAVAAFLAKQGG